MFDVHYRIRIRPWAGHPGWVAATILKSWFSVGERASNSRTVAETWFARGSMTEDEMVITGLLELARAMKDDLS